MRVGLLMFLYLAMQVVGAEVWSYRIGEIELTKALQKRGKTKVQELKSGKREWLGRKVEKPEFESRFFEKTGSWRDCSKILGGIAGKGEFEGQGYFEMERGQLVVRAKRVWHEDFAEVIWKLRPRLVRVKAAVYSVRGRDGKEILTVPKEGKLKGELEVLISPDQMGKGRSADGKLKMEGEAVIGRLENEVVIRGSITSDLAGAVFSLKTRMIVPIGLPWVHEIGSLDRKERLLLVVTPEIRLSDGTRADEWVEKEEGGTFLAKERLARLRSLHAAKGFDGMDDENGTLWVPPNFIDFISTPIKRMGPFAIRKIGKKRLSEFQTDDPGLRKLGVLYNLSEVIHKNGVIVEDENFVVINEAGTKLFTKLGKEDFSLLRGIVKASWKDVMPTFRVKFEQVGKGGEILKRLEIQIMPGGAGVVSLGDDLKAELELQVHNESEAIEVRVGLTETGGDLEKASFELGAVLRNGVPRVVQKSMEEETTEWRMTVSVLEVGKAVDEILKKGER